MNALNKYKVLAVLRYISLYFTESRAWRKVDTAKVSYRGHSKVIESIDFKTLHLLVAAKP